MNDITEVKKSSGLVVFLGILLIICGIISMVAPAISGVVVTLWVGSFMIVGGIFQIFFGLKGHGWGVKTFMIIFGILAIMVGGMLIKNPVAGTLSITLVIAIYFVMDAIMSLIAAFTVDKNRGWLIFNGIMSLILGVMIAKNWPLSGGWAIGTLVGIKMVFTGWGMVFVGDSTRGLAKKIEE